MRMIKLGICVKNIKYAQDMAKVFAFRSSRLDISVMAGKREDLLSECDGMDIILTDREELIFSESDQSSKNDDADFILNGMMILSGKSILEYNPKILLLEGSSKFSGGEEYRRNNHIISKFTGISDILQHVTDIYEENCGGEFYSAADRNTKIYRFISDMGGSGTTAAALTMGRLFSCETEKKVLYIGMGGMRSREWYLGDTEKAMRPVAELECVIRNKQPFDVFSYLRKDRYGLYVLSDMQNSENEAEIVKSIAAKGVFDLIIADMPKRAFDYSFDKTFLVINEKEKRGSLRECTLTEAEKNENVQWVLNRSRYNLKEENAVRIVDDAESFVLTDKGIDIALDKAYAVGIRKLAEPAEL